MSERTQDIFGRKKLRSVTDGSIAYSASSFTVSFADLMTLLVAFFVLRVSTLSLEAPSVRDRFQELTQHTFPANVPVTEEKPTYPSPASLLGRTIEDEFAKPIEILESKMFVPGTADLTFNGLEAIGALVKRIDGKPVRIRIATFTDRSPLNSSRYPSAWELSAAQANTILRQMIDAGVSYQAISVFAYADTFENDESQNDVTLHRNRRIEITVSRKEAV